MKNWMKKTVSALISGMLLMTAAMPAAAAETDIPEQFAESVCEGFVPLSDDIVSVTLPAGFQVDVDIVQHSPERENLVLYSGTVSASAEQGLRAVFRIEPGEYTVTVTADAVRGSSVRRKYEADITVADANDSVGDDAFARTEYAYEIKKANAKETSNAAVSVTDPVETVTSEAKLISSGLTFRQYNVFRGDFDGDGDTDTDDAQNTLNVFTRSLAGLENELTKAQIAACDIDADGTLTSEDAQQILAFATMQITGFVPKWSDGIADVRNYAVNDEGKVVIA